MSACMTRVNSWSHGAGPAPDRGSGCDARQASKLLSKLQQGLSLTAKSPLQVEVEGLLVYSSGAL